MLASFPIDSRFRVVANLWYGEPKKRSKDSKREDEGDAGDGGERRSVTNLQNRWMGEKYDGFRYCWNPHHRCIYPVV